MRRKSALLKVLAAVISTALMFSVTAIAGADVWTDKWLYEQGETVQINGDGMLPGESVGVDVLLPDGTLSQRHEVVADELGNFSDTYVLADDAPGGIYDVVAIGQTSGAMFTTQFDPPPPPDPTTTSQTMTPSTITYGDSTSLTGSLTTNGGTDGEAGKTVNLSAWSTSGCTGTSTIIGSAETAGGGTTPPKGNWGPVEYRPQSAGTQYVKASFAAQGNLDASSDCDTLVVDKADTATTSQPSDGSGAAITQVGVGVPFWVHFTVSSVKGVTGNTATGNVTAGQSAAGLGCDSNNHAVSAAQTTGTGFSYSASNILSAANRISCTPTSAGVYTVWASFASTDGNYNNSDSSLELDGVTVIPVQVQACAAAPAIANAWMQQHNVKSNSKSFVNISSLVAQEMAASKGARFPTYESATDTTPGDLLGPCDNGYQQSVEYRTAFHSTNRTSK